MQGSKWRAVGSAWPFMFHVYLGGGKNGRAVEEEEDREGCCSTVNTGNKFLLEAKLELQIFILI